MSYFIETSIGLINSAHIVLIRPTRKIGEPDLLELVDGRTLECEIRDRTLIRGERGPLVPAAPGTLANILVLDDDGTVDEEVTPILAWRDSGGDGRYMEPIFRQYLCDNERAFLKIGDRLQDLRCDAGSYETLDAAKEAMCAEMREKRRRT